MIISEKELKLPHEYLTDPPPYPKDFIDALRYYTAMQDISKFVTMEECDDNK